MGKTNDLEWVSILSNSQEGLDFIQSILTDKGWITSGTDRGGEINSTSWLWQKFRGYFVVPEVDSEDFRRDLIGACLPWGLEPVYRKSDLVILKDIGGS